MLLLTVYDMWRPLYLMLCIMFKIRYKKVSLAKCVNLIIGWVYLKREGDWGYRSVGICWRFLFYLCQVKTLSKMKSKAHVFVLKTGDDLRDYDSVCVWVWSWKCSGWWTCVDPALPSGPRGQYRAQVAVWGDAQSQRPAGRTGTHTRQQQRERIPGMWILFPSQEEGNSASFWCGHRCIMGYEALNIIQGPKGECTGAR